tara:strand:- start:1200 stop:1811 length:612 start_codon:yes stop_codon:yes gene_type:complete
MELTNYIKDIYRDIPSLSKDSLPWEIIDDIDELINSLIPGLNKREYLIQENTAIHETAIVEGGATIKRNTIIGPRCIVKSGAYLRNGVYLVSDVTIGANTEIKQSIIFKNSCAAHLNYVGNSLIGEDVNLEAGSVLANHFNEREDKHIVIKEKGEWIDTGVTKFGSLIGDGSKIGANSVLNPGTILPAKTIVPRLTHINQAGT